MSLRKRVEKLETAVGEGAEVIIFITNLENRDGTTEFHSAFAAGGGRQYVASADGESLDDFRTRVESLETGGTAA